MSLLQPRKRTSEIIDIQVTCDGTWSKRGHQAIYGIVVIAAWATGQVIHTEVLSKYCAECHAKRGADTSSEDFLDWYEEHQGQCHVNHYGSSNAMEADGVVVIWQRSIEEHKLHYTSVIADAKTYKAICDGKPYGPGVEIVKHECVGHVQKRMMNHLKALKQSNPVDSDGRRIRIGGWNRITDVVRKFLKNSLDKWCDLCRNSGVT